MICPNCGAAVTETQAVCACGAPSGSVWPPPVAAEPPKTLSVPVRLLTGKIWLDQAVGMSLFWLWLFGLNKTASLMVAAYTVYVVRLPFPQEPLNFNIPWLGLGTLALTVLAGTYLGLHQPFPVMSRSFGQTALWGVGVLLVVFLCLMLFR